jgi:hypothetical protein
MFRRERTQICHASACMLQKVEPGLACSCTPAKGAEAGLLSVKKDGMEAERVWVEKPGLTGLHGRDSPRAKGLPVQPKWNIR